MIYNQFEYLQHESQLENKYVAISQNKKRRGEKVNIVGLK